MKTKNILKKLVVAGILIAANIVISRFLSIPLWNMKFSFAFLTVALAARYCGIWGAIAVNGIGDFLGAILFPTGAYFPGFTLTAAIVGLIMGCYIAKQCNFTRIVLCTLTHQILCTLLLNTLWISIVYKTPFDVQLIARLPQAGIMSVLQIIILYLLFVKFDITKKIGRID